MNLCLDKKNSLKLGDKVSVDVYCDLTLRGVISETENHIYKVNFYRGGCTYTTKDMIKKVE